MKDTEDELGNLENLLDKEEVLERLDGLKGDINRRRSAVREPLDDRDELGQALAELHQKYIDLMRDLDRERRKRVRNLLLGCLFIKQLDKLSQDTYWKIFGSQETETVV